MSETNDDKREWSEVLWNPLIENQSSLIECREVRTRVAAYARVSYGVGDKVKSLENQIHYYTMFIKNKPNWKLMGVYFDNGLSGINISKRLGFNRLLRHCTEGKIDLILTKSVSRFSRNTKELINVVNHLKSLNVAIYFEKENIDTSKDYNDFLLTTYAALAQNEIENISQATTWGYEKRLLKGIPYFGALLGYRVENNNGIPIVKIHAEEAEIVREIFDLFLSGLSLREIARRLMKQGVKTSAGGEIWNGFTVKYILTNIAYVGDKLARAKTRDLLSNTVKSSDGLRNQYFIENSHPAIISKDVFNRVQARLKEKEYKKVGKRLTKTIRPLSSRILCGLCGFNYHHIYDRKKSRWRCRTKAIGKEMCNSEVLDEKKIEEMIKKAFQLHYDFKVPNVIRDILKQIQAINQNDQFEYHRLSYFSRMEIAREEEKYASEEELPKAKKAREKLEQEYLQFEENAKKIEEDRKYRNKAINWMQEVKSIDDFLENITVEHMRAWVMNITIFSEEAYIVYWIDNTETKVGDCVAPAKPKEKNSKLRREGGKFKKIKLAPKPENRAGQYTKRKSVDKEVPNSSNMEVMKIDPGEDLIMVSKLKKKIEKTNIAAGKKSDKPKIRTASYCRVSTEIDKQKLSLNTQVAYYTYLILKNPEMEFAGIFADEGLSGTKVKNRTEFNRLINKCIEGKIDLIITKSISRFARNTVDCLKYVRMLKSLKKPVYVYFERENINTSDKDSEFMITILSSLAQEESMSMAISSKWGKQKLAQRGIVKFSRPPYGYEFDEKMNLVINSAKAAIVSRIYQDYLNGKSATKIAQELSEDKIKSPTGLKHWYSSVVDKILSNEAYKGCMLYQKTYIKDMITQKAVVNKGELPQYYIEDHHPAIVTSEVWDAVQEIRDAKPKKAARLRQQRCKAQDFFNIFCCGECGGVISHQASYYKSSAKKNKAKHYWRCRVATGQDFSGKCGAPGFREEYIEHTFMNMLLEMKKSDRLKNEVEAVIAKTTLSKEEVDLVEKIKEEMELLNQELYQAVDSELNKKGQDTRKVEALTDQIVKLNNQVGDYSDRQEKAEKLKSDLNWLLKELKGLEDFDPEKECIPFRLDIFGRIVQSGTVHSNGRIVYELKLGIHWEAFLEEKQSWKLEIKKGKKEI